MTAGKIGSRTIFAVGPGGQRELSGADSLAAGQNENQIGNILGPASPQICVIHIDRRPWSLVGSTKQFTTVDPTNAK